MEATIIFLLVVGLVLIIVSIYLIKKEDKERAELNVRIDDVFKAVNSSLEMIDNNSTEFNNLCELIFREIDEKYQELLTIYSLIEQYKSEFENVDISNEDVNVKKNDDKKSNNKDELKKLVSTYDDAFVYKNKNAKEIFSLYDSGMSINNIAKKLSIGKGEVQLMLNIRKV